jgi:surface protein
MEGTTNLKQTFNGCSAFNGDISYWAVIKVTDMEEMFRSASSFNSDISSWDVGKVATMKTMFFNSAFNGDISSWAVDKVTNMEALFMEASAFNGDLAAWNVRSVTLCNVFCAANGGFMCSLPSFINRCGSSGCGSCGFIQSLNHNSACSCPAGEVGTPGSDALCQLETAAPTGTPTVTTAALQLPRLPLQLSPDCPS